MALIQSDKVAVQQKQLVVVFNSVNVNIRELRPSQWPEFNSRSFVYASFSKSKDVLYINLYHLLA